MKIGKREKRDRQKERKETPDQCDSPTIKERKIDRKPDRRGQKRGGIF